MKTTTKTLFTIFLFSIFFFNSKDIAAQEFFFSFPSHYVTRLVKLNLTIQPFTSSSRYPADSLLVSTPLTLKFEFNLKPNYFPGGKSTVPLYELRYSVMDQYGQEFFNDRVDLYGQKGPGTLEVYPGIDIPLGANRITVSATLHYRGTNIDGSHSDASADSTRTEEVTTLPRGIGNYQYYRNGFIKRHILNSGRALPGVWLKEYEPGKDRKELLYHSRTSKFSADPEGKTRIYVPWIDKCDSDADFTTGCGLSISPGSDTIHSGSENPLLQTGLAIATFAREYSYSGHIESLDHAIDLFQYIKKSEWIDMYGNRTGFFLRGDYPGRIFEEVRGSDEEYLFASADEIIGMTLGLYYLNEALKVAPDYYSYYPNIKNELVDLVHRLGNQLKNNYYFIVPLTKRPDENEWHNYQFGPLPRQIHKGYAGLYAYQWFLAGGFKAITGFGYRPPDPQLGGAMGFTHPFLEEMEDLLTYRVADDEGDEEERDLVKLAILAKKDSLERAILAIKFIGFGMYFSDQDYTLPVGYTVHIPKFDRYNFPMLLHAYQLGMADTTRSTDARGDITRLMRELIVGVLSEGSFLEIEISISEIADGFYGFLADAIRLAAGVLTGGMTELFGLMEVSENIGTPEPDRDLYAAAVALRYRLPDTYSEANSGKRDFMWREIQGLSASFEMEFASNLPVGERQTVPGYENNPYIDHNTFNKIGGTFVWESRVDDRILGGGDDGHSGLSNTKIQDLYNLGYDAMIEGAGLGFLWPKVLFEANSSYLDSYETSNVPLSPFCAQQPRLLTSYAPASDLQCSFSFPSIARDWFDKTSQCNITGDPCEENTDCGLAFVPLFSWRGNLVFGPRVQICEHKGNDSYFLAREIQWGLRAGLTVDKATFIDYRGHGRGGEYWYALPIGTARHIIDPEQDYDYYYLNNDDELDITVTVHADPGIILYVDGESATLTVDNDPHSRTISMPGKHRHVIMVTSRNTAIYQINITGERP